MNIEKLKPWNWFKDEDTSNSQIPVTKHKVSSDRDSKSADFTPTLSSPVGSLMQLHNEMGRLFDDVWRSFGMPIDSRFAREHPKNFDNSSIFKHFPASLDISGSEKEYEISVDLPSFTETDVNIELSGNTLTISGEKEEKNEHKDKHYYQMERSFGSVRRTLSLPEDADTDGIKAHLKNGLLTINIPRKELPKSNIKRIAISS